MAVGFQHIAGPSIADLRARLQGIKGAAFRARLAQNLAEEARTQVANCFREERDPYGRPWEPLASRKGKILQKTGRMSASVTTGQVGPDGFALEITATYAKYHQYGTKPHQRAERSAKQNARGRFVKKNRSGLLLKIKAHTNPGLPQRQMIPMVETGGLGSIWAAAFNHVTAQMLDETLRGA